VKVASTAQTNTIYDKRAFGEAIDDEVWKRYSLN
jgi:hypothetical protein